MPDRIAPAGNDTIYFLPGRKLVWENFTGIPVVQSRASAITTSGFGYEANIEYSDDAGALQIKLYCFFNKKSSWVKAGKKTRYILEHEQKHFDITYIGACSFLNELSKMKLTTRNYNAELEKVYRKCYREMQAMQDAYDNETKNGQLEDIQSQWNARIDGWMAGL
jgi:predicted restriction endonuclease